MAEPSPAKYWQNIAGMNLKRTMSIEQIKSRANNLRSGIGTEGELLEALNDALAQYASDRSQEFSAENATEFAATVPVKHIRPVAQLAVAYLLEAKAIAHAGDIDHPLGGAGVPSQGRDAAYATRARNLRKLYKEANVSDVAAATSVFVTTEPLARLNG